MQEYLNVLNPLLAGEAVRVKGDLFRINAQLTIADATRPSVIVAAKGPRMVKLAGEMSAGTFLGWAGPKNVRGHAAPLITGAAAAAGRPAPRIGAAYPSASPTTPSLPPSWRASCSPCTTRLRPTARSSTAREGHRG